MSKEKKYTLKLRSNNFYVFYWDSVHSKTMSECLYTDDYQLANQKAKEIISSITSSPIINKPIIRYWDIINHTGIWYEKVIERCRTKGTQKAKQNAIEMFIRDAHITSIDDINTEMIITYLLTISNISTRTMRYAYIHSCFDIAKEKNIFNININWKEIKELTIKKYSNDEQDNKPFLTISERNELLNIVKEHSTELYIALSLGFYAGTRITESANILWSEIDMNNNIIHIRNHSEKVALGITAFRTKSGKHRDVPLHATLKQILIDNPNTSPYVVDTNSYRQEFQPTRLTTSLETWLHGKHYSKWFTPHTARHSFASHLAQANVSILKISKWLGHASVDFTAKVYAHLQSGDDIINSI